MPEKQKNPIGPIDTLAIWDGIRERNLLPIETSIALAIFASEYVEVDSRLVTDYSPFKEY